MTEATTNKRHNIFFNDAISISELRELGNLALRPDEYSLTSKKINDLNQAEFNNWISKSCNSKLPNAETFHQELAKMRLQTIDERLPFQHTPPPPGFPEQPSPKFGQKPAEQPQKRILWADISSDSDFTPFTGKTPVLVPDQAKKEEPPAHKIPNVEVVKNEVKLSSPPKKKKSVVKREARGHFNEEEVEADITTGTLKFYQLKKRFGFITLDRDDSDVFLCEDDIILSSINFKKFRDDVVNKQPIHFRFQIKNYKENGRPKRKAINIEIIQLQSNK